MNTHHEPIDHPLTETDAVEMSMKFAPSVMFQMVASVAPDDLTEYARAAFDAGQKYQDDLEDSTIRDVMQDIHHLRVERDDAVARAERAEERLSDSVHVDEAARRVEAAREQGWDDAAQHIYNKGWEGVTALRKANPYRPALSLPTDAFATNPPADADRPWEPLNGPVRVGDEVRQEAFGFAVTAVVARVDGRGDPLTAEGAIIGDLRHGTWYVRRPQHITPNTWKMADQ